MAIAPGESWRRASALVLLIAVAGCARVERARECQRLAATVNAELDEIQAIAQELPESETVHDGGSDAPRAAVRIAEVRRFHRISEHYLELSEELTAFETEDAELGKKVEQYARIVDRAGHAAERLADAHAEQHPHRVQASRRELKKLTDRHRATTRQIDQYCIGP